MKHLASLLLLLLIASHLVAAPGGDPKPGDPKLTADILGGLKFRCIGPAITSGRIVDIAMHPRDRNTWYIAVAYGGVWKTTNAGTTWEAIFENERSSSIGCVAVDPNNPHVVWVGTGENNSQRSVGWGDGVYRSEDGGKSWRCMGLKTSEHIAKILIDPRNANTVLVACQGPLWAAGGERGVYRTQDGGKTWKAVLTISDNTGITDLVMDPRNPDLLYAASYQRRRHVWTMIDGGPETNMYRSADGGATWDTLRTGLPGVEKGRIGLAISPVNPDVLFAVIEAADKAGGFFRSTDRGATWEKRSSYTSSNPQYYQELLCDPVDVDRVYSLDTYLSVTDDGGRTFRTLGNRNRHVDDHAMWIEPTNASHLIVGGDGGLYESFDRGATWRFFENLPITQFYRITADNTEPFYWVYGGTQDNNSLGAPSRTLKSDGIMSEDWLFTNGGDGFKSQIDPVDPNIVYAQAQYGDLTRFDRKSGERVSIQPQPGMGEAPLRWNWDSPLIISPHKHTRLWFAANRVFRSDDRGDTWTAVSGDLTRQIDRNTLPVFGAIPSVDAVAKHVSTSFYGNIITLSESPLVDGLLYAGTDDGLIQVTKNGGGSWTAIGSFPKVPANTYVSAVVTSQHAANTVYAAFDNHKNADFTAYLLRSTDNGASWESIAGDLPKEPVYCIAEDHVNPRLLFVGTEFGLYVTVDGGKRWMRMKAGLPSSPIKDIAIQKRENDLVLASFGRGIFILDDYTPLRTLTDDAVKRDGFVFPVKDAWMYITAWARSKGAQGETFFTAPNPEFGATFTYYLREVPKTRRQVRRDAEKEARAAGRIPPYPAMEQLREEEEQKPAEVQFTIRDEEGTPVRVLTAPMQKGVQRIVWDLRYSDRSPIRAGAGPNGSAMLAMPGRYTVSMATVIDGRVTVLDSAVALTAKVLETSTLPAADRRALVEFQQKLALLQRTVLGASSRAAVLKERLGAIRSALASTPAAPRELFDERDAMERRLSAMQRALNGDPLLSERNENQPPSITGRLMDAVWNQWGSTSPPTTTNRDAVTIVEALFAPVQAELKALDAELKALEGRLDVLGAPWTPGR